MKIPRSSLFEVFSIDFAGPLPKSTSGNRFLLICVEHLTGWPIVKATATATAETVRGFIESLILIPFGAPGQIVSDNAACFRAKVLQDFMCEIGAKWHTVLAYAPMSNGKAERMVGTIKSGIGRLVQDNGKEWDEVVDKVVFGYCRRPMRDGMSPFELLYGVAPRLLPWNVPRSGNGTESFRKTELLTVFGARATRVWQPDCGKEKKEKKSSSLR